MIDGGDVRLVLYSKLAFYPVHWLALEELVRRYRAGAVALAAPPPELTSLHAALGTADPERADGLPIEVRRMPTGSRRVYVKYSPRTGIVRPSILSAQPA